MRLLVKEYSQYDWANTNASIIHYIHFVFTVSQWMGHPFYASADTQHFFAVAAAFFSSYTYTRGVVVALDVVTLQNSINNIRSTCRAEKKMFVTPKRTMLNQHQIFTHSMEVFGLNFKIHVFILKKKMYEIKKKQAKKKSIRKYEIYSRRSMCLIYIYISGLERKEHASSYISTGHYRLDLVLLLLVLVQKVWVWRIWIRFRDKLK